MVNMLKGIFEIAEKLIYDLREPIGYLPIGFAVAITAWIFLWTARKICQSRKMQSRRAAMIAVFFGYLAVIAMQTFFSREPGSRTGIDLVLFSTWGRTAQAHAYVVENVILFLPFGILFPMAFPYFRTMIRCTGCGLLLSVLIETSQLITSRGHCQADDVLMNTLGAWIGYLMLKVLLKLWEMKGCTLRTL